MKRAGIMNSEIASVLAKLGHTDTIVIADCGLPIPDGVKRIDLAFELGKPGFMEILKAVSADMAVERVTLAEEIDSHNPRIQTDIKELLPDVEYDYVSHEQFKESTHRAKAVIRTGEATPYSNVILQAGVIF